MTWLNGTEAISSPWQLRVEHENGTGSTESEINLDLRRWHLGAKLTCKVNSSALDTPIYRSVHINMDLVPATLEMRSSRPETSSVLREGDKMTVTCVASGAKPEAKVSNLNN